MKKLQKAEIENLPIPVGGTLGLLAYGYRGVMIWRQTRHELEQQSLRKSITAKPTDEKK